MHDVNELRRRYADGTVTTVAGNEISLEELNFQKCIIGSDEAGKGEIFRPLITVAAYANPENIDKLMELNVKDSKSYGDGYEDAKKIFYPIAEKLTGFTSYKDFKGKEGQVIRTDYVTFVASALLNSKFNKDFKPGSGKKSGNLHELQRHEYKIVLLTLARAVPSYDYMVVDDFQDGWHHDRILETIDIPAGQTVIVTKADSKVMAVACASVIAYYLTNLYVDAVDQMLESEYGISMPLDRGTHYNEEAFQAPLRKLNEISKEKYEEFLAQYAKKHYMRNIKLGG